MAIIFMDGFDHYTSLLDKWDWAIPIQDGSYVPSIGGGYARYGAGGVAFQTQGSGWGGRDANLAKLTPTMGATGVVGFACLFGSAITSQEGYRYPLQIYDSFNATRHIAIGWSSAPSPAILSVFGPSSLIGTGTIPINFNQWNYVELGFTIADSGSFELRINGIQSVAGTGDTSGGGSATAGWVRFRNQISTFYLDDVYMASGSTFYGDTRVQYLAPSGAGVRTDFTPLSSTNWSNVDETTPNDNDYNSSNVVGATDLFAMSNIGNGQVHAVQTYLRHRKDDAGFRTVQPVLYRSDVDDGGTPPSTTPRWYRGSKAQVLDNVIASIQTIGTSPLSGSSWTKDEINALQFGYAVGDAAMFTIDATVV